LLSMATMDAAKFEQAARSLKGALGVLEKYTTPMQQESMSVPKDIETIKRLDIYESISQIEAMAEELGLEDQFYLERTETGLMIQMGEQILYDLGKAELRPEAYPVLAVVGIALRETAVDVQIAGHTDTLPINTKEFPSNWELSSARAMSVVQYLIKNAAVPPEILGAAGYGEFRPIAPNTSAENRQRNRRVEFNVTWR